LDKRVRVKQNGRTVTGTVEEVDPMDGIVLRLESGHPRTLRSEHVEHLEVM
jgi:biotin-(acetyl-CoA carboxylase) ligase